MAHPHPRDRSWTRGQGKFPDPGHRCTGTSNFRDLRQIVHGTQGGFRSNVTCDKKKPRQTLGHDRDGICMFTGFLTPCLHASFLVLPHLHPPPCGSLLFISGHMAKSTLSYHLHTALLFTISDLKTLALPVVSGTRAFSCFSLGLLNWPHTVRFHHRRHSSLYLPLLHIVFPDSPMPFSGFGFMLFILGSRISRSHMRFRKMPSIIPTAPFQRVAFLSKPHAFSAGQ